MRENAWRYYRKSDNRWYRKWREPGSRKLHQQLESRWMWEQSYGPIPEGYEVHHRNHNGADNRLDNFELVTAAWHDNYHQREREDHRTLEGVEQRRCQRCQEYKLLSCFKRRKAGTYQGYCESCALKYLRAWREANREHYNAYMRAYRKRKPQ